MQNFRKLLGKEEKIVLQSKPSLLPYVLSDSFIVLALVAAVLVVVRFPYSGFTPEAFFSVILSGTLTGLAIALLFVPFSYMMHKHVIYIVTNKKVICFNGIRYSVDFGILDFNEIHKIKVFRGAFDRLFSTGNIFLYAVENNCEGASSNTVYVMKNVPDAEKVRHLIMKKTGNHSKSF